MINPLGLFHLSSTLFIGSLNLIILFIEASIPSIFFGFKVSLSIKLSGRLFSIANLISLLFSLRIIFLFLLINCENFTKTLFLLLLSILILDAFFAFTPIFIKFSFIYTSTISSL